jgi:site-specific recombinase XerD
VPLNATARGAVADYLAARPAAPPDAVGGFLFVTAKGDGKGRAPGGPMAKRTVQMLVTNTMKRAGIVGGHVHSLRHLCATNVYEATKDILVVKDLLGHQSISTTTRYSHRSAEDAQAAVDSSKANVMGETKTERR